MSSAEIIPAQRSANVPIGAYDRLFYGSMAVAMTLTVFIGFSPTYYLRLLGEGARKTVSGGPITTLIHVHAALFTAWVVLFLLQTTLIAAHKVALHRRLGIAGAALAAAMIVAGTLTAIAAASGASAPPGTDPLEFLIIPLFDLLLFAAFITSAIAMRRNKEAHKRLMLLSYCSILAAAAARLPGMLALGPPAFFGLVLLFIVAGAVYDLVSRGKVHKVYIWGGAIFVASVPLRLAISTTPAWKQLAGFLTR